MTSRAMACSREEHRFLIEIGTVAPNFWLDAFSSVIVPWCPPPHDCEAAAAPLSACWGVQGRTALPLFRAGIDDLPELRTVLDLLHLGGEPAIPADPILHGIRIIGHQIRGSLGAGDLDAEGEGLVVIGQVEADARFRRYANLVYFVVTGLNTSVQARLNMLFISINVSLRSRMCVYLVLYSST